MSYPPLTLHPPQAPSAAALKAKREFLATAGVLQAAAPEATQFVVLASAPLPEELSTTVQVWACVLARVCYRCLGRGVLTPRHEKMSATVQVRACVIARVCCCCLGRTVNQCYTVGRSQGSGLRHSDGL